VVALVADGVRGRSFCAAAQSFVLCRLIERAQDLHIGDEIGMQPSRISGFPRELDALIFE
jgi:hypothetical protein